MMLFMMTKILAIGNPAIDHILHVPDQALAEHNLTKGSGDYSRTPVEIGTLILNHGPSEIVPGGAVANTMHTLAQLGVGVTYIGHYGDDAAGQTFARSMRQVGVALPNPLEDVESFNLAVLVTPDGERTFVGQPMPKPLQLQKKTVEQNFAQSAQWLVVEGYPLFDAPAQEAVQYAISRAKDKGIKVALAISSLALVEFAWGALSEVILQGVDLIIANKEEMEALEQKAQSAGMGLKEPLHKKIIATARVVTNGGHGASHIDEDGNETAVFCSEIAKPVDTTGAGDAFAAGFFYGLVNGSSLEEALQYGHTLGRKVIMQEGARMEGLSAAVFQEQAA
jgi:sugar/nucleoside kinase (ribokinase family)